MEGCHVFCSRGNCGREIGLFDAEQNSIVLVGVRESWLNPVSIVTEFNLDGTNTCVLRNDIEEIEPASDAIGSTENDELALMNVSDLVSSDVDIETIDAIASNVGVFSTINPEIVKSVINSIENASSMSYVAVANTAVTAAIASNSSNATTSSVDSFVSASSNISTLKKPMLPLKKRGQRKWVRKLEMKSEKKKKKNIEQSVRDLCESGEISVIVVNRSDAKSLSGALDDVNEYQDLAKILPGENLKKFSE